MGLRFDVIIFISCCFVVPCYLIVLIDYIFTVVVYICFIVVLLCYYYISITIGYGNLIDMLIIC